MKIIASGHSLTHFGKFRDHYDLTQKERRELKGLIVGLLQRLAKTGRLRGLGVPIVPGRVIPKIANYGLDTGDALHVYHASRRCPYILTTDGDFARKKEVSGVKIMLPEEFCNEARNKGFLRT